MHILFFISRRLRKEASLSKIPSPTKDLVRNEENIERIYRQFQILFNAYFEFTKDIVWPGHQILCFCLGVSCLYGTFKFPGTMNFVAYMGMPIFSSAANGYCLIAYTYLGGFEDTCESFRKSWKYTGTTQQIKNQEATKMFLRSCRDIRSRISAIGFYYFRRGTTSTYFSAVISYTVTLLLSF